MESSPEDVAFIDIFWLDFCLWLFFFCQWMWMSALDLLCAAYHTIWLRCIEWHLNGNSYTHYFSSTGSVMPGASFSPLSSFLLSTPQWHWIAAIWQTRPGSLREWQVPKVLPLYILKQWPTVISLWLWPVNILGSYTVVWDLRRFLVWSQSGGRWGQDEDEREREQREQLQSVACKSSISSSLRVDSALH